MIVIQDKCYINEADLTTKEIEEIKDDLTVENQAYYNALRYSGYNSTRIPKNIYLYSHDRKNRQYVVPRGYGYTMLDKYIDKSLEHTVKFPQSLIQLRDVQKEAEKAYFNDTTKGLIVLNTGMGKSILGLHISFMLRQKTLIVVHKDDLVKGWQKDAKVVFGDNFKMGLIKAKKFEIGEQITIATIQTLNRLDSDKLRYVTEEFGCVIVDEVHRAGSKQYDLINEFKGAYRIGLTATLERSDSFAKNIYAMFGDVAYYHKVKKSEDILPVKVFMRNTGIRYIPKCYKKGTKYVHIPKEEWHLYHPLYNVTDVPHKLLKGINYFDIENNMVENTRYMQMVLRDVLSEVKKGHKCVMAFKQKQHIDLYAKYLEAENINHYKYYGDSKDSKDVMLQEAEKADVTLVTYGIATEGTNVKSWQSLFLVASINDAKNTEQIVGRIRRTDNKKKEAYVFDYYSNDVWGTRRHKDTRRRRYIDLGFTVKEV